MGVEGVGSGNNVMVDFSTLGRLMKADSSGLTKEKIATAAAAVETQPETNPASQDGISLSGAALQTAESIRNMPGMVTTEKNLTLDDFEMHERANTDQEYANSLPNLDEFLDNEDPDIADAVIAKDFIEDSMECRSNLADKEGNIKNQKGTDEYHGVPMVDYSVNQTSDKDGNVIYFSEFDSYPWEEGNNPIDTFEYYVENDKEHYIRTKTRGTQGELDYEVSAIEVIMSDNGVKIKVTEPDSTLQNKTKIAEEINNSDNSAESHESGNTTAAAISFDENGKLVYEELDNYPYNTEPIEGFVSDKNSDSNVGLKGYQRTGITYSYDDIPEETLFND
jgi:hypothetical protein